MKTTKCVLLILLAVCLLMSGCAFTLTAAAAPAETEAPTEAPAQPAGEPAEAPTEAPTEPAETGKFTLKETVFPETDAATGTLKFYINDQEIYAGGPVASLLNAGITTYEDFSQVLQPWHTSSVLRVRVEMADVKENDLPYVFFVALNASNEPKKISDCIFYSISINTSKGVKFGSGKEETPFVTGETTMDELVEAYGTPDYDKSADVKFREMAYYEPFNCAYFTSYQNKVRQVWTYYSANYLGDLAAEFKHDLKDSYFGNDCFILMSQYMDVAPYLPTATEEVKTGVVKALSEEITMDGKLIKLGMDCADMPAPFGDAFVGQLMPVHKMYYLLAGRNNPEEFYFININGQKKDIADTLTVKGVFTANKYYSNWGLKNSAYHEFRYENLTQNSTIEDVLEQYGQPLDMRCSSNARNCFAWLFYKDEAGNSLEIRVDPILNQIVELHIFKYYEGEILYQ